MPIAGMNAFLPDVIATGAPHAVPSGELERRTLLTSHPGSKRQSCHVTQTRPDESTSAAGSGKKRSPLGEFTWISATSTTAEKLRPPSREMDEPIRRPPQLKTTTSSPVGRTTGIAPTASVTAIGTGLDQLAPPSVDVSTARLPSRTVSV